MIRGVVGILKVAAEYGSGIVLVRKAYFVYNKACHRYARLLGVVDH
jgi:hypothetical protein